MRFSLKWLLAGMAYCVVAAAIFLRPKTIYVDALRIVTFLGVLYAINLAVFSRGSRRVLAVGFAIGSALFAICNHAKTAPLPPEQVVALLSDDPHALNGPLATPAANAAFLSRIRAANAVGTVLAGLCGSICAYAASRPSRTEDLQA